MGTALWNTENASLFADAADTPLPCADALWVSCNFLPLLLPDNTDPPEHLLVERLNRFTLAICLPTRTRSSCLSYHFFSDSPCLLLITLRLCPLPRPLKERIRPLNRTSRSSRSRMDSRTCEMDREELVDWI